MKLYTPSRVSRRLQERFHFKAERDATPKSAMVRRPYPPGAHGKKRRRGLSEFGTDLQEKQKVRYVYGLSDAALKEYVRRAGRIPGKTKTEALFELLERRLDNVVFRLGLAPTRRIARHLVSHGHISRNGLRVRTPSLLVRTGERIAVREASRARVPFGGLALRLRSHQPPEWLALESEALAGAIRRMPRESDSPMPYNLNKIIGYYSR